MIPPVIRRSLPPICLVALIGAAWALPYRPDCDSLARSDDPAIARIDSQCILLSHYAYAHTCTPTARPTHPELVEGRPHSPNRWESFYDMVQLVKLAQDQDLAGFRNLATETRNPDIRGMLEDLTPTEFMETMKKSDDRQLEQMLREREVYLESVGHERYWQELLPARLRREMAISQLEEAVLEASADGPYAEVARLAWLAYQQRAFEGVTIELTRAAPSSVSVDRAPAYLAEVLQEEQDELSEEYRRWLERRGERLRSTPPPLRPNSN